MAAYLPPVRTLQKNSPHYLRQRQVPVLREDFRGIPADTVVASGESAILECVPPRGHPTPLVRWRRNGEVISIANSNRHELIDEGSLLIKEAVQGDSGEYTCEAWNLAGSKTTPPISLSVHIKPSFIRVPQDLVTLSDRTVEFECQVTGDPPPSVAWRRAKGSLPKHRHLILEDHTLRISDVTLSDQDTYFCEAVNVVGTSRANASLTVYTAPVFVVRPRDVRVTPGSSAAFECLVEGSPSPLVVWSRQDDEKLFLLRRSTPTGTPDDHPNMWVNGEGTLIINHVNPELSGWYTCFAISASGSLVARALLEVSTSSTMPSILPPRLPPPVITVRPRNLTLIPESVALLACQAQGEPNPTITWTKDGKHLSETDQRITALASGTLQINDVEEEDSGVYTCIAESSAGKSAVSSAVRVLAPDSEVDEDYYSPSVDIRDLPGAPQNLHLIGGNATSLSLAWNAPRNEGSSPIISYMMEIWGGKWTAWEPLEVHIPATSYTVTDLEPNTQYRAIVQAMNMDGTSMPSGVSGPLLTSTTQGQIWSDSSHDAHIRSILSRPLISLLPPQPMSSTSVRLIWKVHNHLDYMDGFHIRYRSLSPTENFAKSKQQEFSLQTVQKSYNNTHVIENLEKFADYEVFLVPYHNRIHGHPSNSRTFTTLEDIPSLPPTDIEVFLVNSTSSVVSWEPPPPSSVNGVLSHFSFFLVENHTHLHSNISIDGDSYSVRLHNLTLGSHYSASIAANTRIGQGPTSLTHSWLQDPSAPPFAENKSPRRSHSHFLTFLKETWFIIVVGVAVFVILFLFVAVVFIHRRKNEKRAVNGFRTESRIVNGPSMTSGLWIERGPWPHSAAAPEGKCETSEKLLNVNGPYIEYKDTTDGTVVPKISNNVNQNPLSNQNSVIASTPVAYATTTIIRGRTHTEDIGPNISYHGVYGDTNTDDNLTLYCTLKKQQLYKSSPVATPRPYEMPLHRGYYSPWHQQYNTPELCPPNAVMRIQQSPFVTRAINHDQDLGLSTGSLPRMHQLASNSAFTQTGRMNAIWELSPSTSINAKGPLPSRRDPTDPLPSTDTTLSPKCMKSVSPTVGGMHGLQGLSGSRMMGSPGIPRCNNNDLDSVKLPNMHSSSSTYQPQTTSEPGQESSCQTNILITSQCPVYESTSLYYGTSPVHSISRVTTSQGMTSGSAVIKTISADRTNPLLERIMFGPSGAAQQN